MQKDFDVQTNLFSACPNHLNPAMSSYRARQRRRDRDVLMTGERDDATKVPRPPRAAGLAALVPLLAARNEPHGIVAAFGPGLSLLLHGTLLALAVTLSVGNLRQEQTGKEIVVGIEVLPPASFESPAPKAEQPPPPKPEPVADKPKPAHHRPAILEHSETPSAAASLVPASDGTAAQPPAPPVAAGSPPGSEDAMRLYAQALWSQIIRHKPRSVRFQGTVLLSFRLSENGELLDPGIARSSGASSLDGAALQALTEAAPFPPPPGGLGPERLRFTIPFAFE